MGSIRWSGSYFKSGPSWLHPQVSKLISQFIYLAIIALASFGSRTSFQITRFVAGCVFMISFDSVQNTFLLQKCQQVMVGGGGQAAAPLLLQWVVCTLSSAVEQGYFAILFSIMVQRQPELVAPSFGSLYGEVWFHERYSSGKRSVSARGTHFVPGIYIVFINSDFIPISVGRPSETAKTYNVLGFSWTTVSNNSIQGFHAFFWVFRRWCLDLGRNIVSTNEEISFIVYIYTQTRSIFQVYRYSLTDYYKFFIHPYHYFTLFYLQYNLPLPSVLPLATQITFTLLFHHLCFLTLLPWE